MAGVGIDHVMTGDHVMFHDGVGNDGLTDAASLLTATEDLGVYLAVYLMVLRHPLVVARQIMTAAQFGRGRLVPGPGHRRDDRREVEACGIDPRTRGRRSTRPWAWSAASSAARPSATTRVLQLEAARLRPVRRAGAAGGGWAIRGRAPPGGLGDAGSASGLPPSAVRRPSPPWKAMPSRRAAPG